jgi:hypothetical protein
MEEVMVELRLDYQMLCDLLLLFLIKPKVTTMGTQNVLLSNWMTASKHNR